MYIPYRKLTISSSLSPKEVIERFSKSTQKPKISFTQRQSSTPFIGKIDQDTFSIRRAISYRNSFLPQIKGLVYQESNNTNIDIKMTLHPFVIAFMCVWMGGLMFIECLILITAIFKIGEFHGDPVSIGLGPIGMMLFGYCLMTIPFQIEANKAEELITKITT